jgi:hypothetical protein
MPVCCRAFKCKGIIRSVPHQQYNNVWLNHGTIESGFFEHNLDSYFYSRVVILNQWEKRTSKKQHVTCSFCWLKDCVPCLPWHRTVKVCFMA